MAESHSSEPGSQESSLSPVGSDPVRSLFAPCKRDRAQAENDSDTDDDLDEPILCRKQRNKRLRRRLKREDEDEEQLHDTLTRCPPHGLEENASSRVADKSISPLTGYIRGSNPLPGDKVARKRLAMIDLSGRPANDAGGWCDQNPWSVQVRDSELRTPEHADYDPSTLHIPPDVLARMSPFQRQFWELKSRYYSTMLFVKKGAFMEAYDIDADIVHKELGLNYTGGGRASMRCAGVPESSLNRHAARLIDLGYRVGIVAQTETANAADKRKASQKHHSSSDNPNTSKVCQRTLVRILTKATVTDDELLRDHRARFVVALCEADQSTASDIGDMAVGICHVDAAAGRVTIGQYLDDNRRSWTEKLLTTLRPPEIIVPRKSSLSSRMKALMRWISTGSTAVDIMYRGENEGFAPMTSSRLQQYLSSSTGGDAVRRVNTLYLDSNPLAAKAFGAMANYLSALLIDKEILSLGNYVLLPSSSSTNRVASSLSPGPDQIATSSISDQSADACTFGSKSHGAHKTTDEFDVVDDAGYDPSRTLSGGLQMDSATMANLEVVANVVDGSERDALISVVDRAATPAGKRLLRRWISDPLTLSEAINDRLNAVEILQTIDSHTCSGIRRLLASGPDLERWLARLHQFAVVDDVAVMFDDSNARKVKEFIKVLRGMQSSLEALEKLRSELPTKCNARRLFWLLTPGSGYHHSTRTELEFFFGSAFDVHAAETQGEMIPMPGAAPAYDEAKDALEFVEMQLDDELKRWQEFLNDKSIVFYHRAKETFQLEIKTESLRGKRIPSDFTPSSEAKNVKRFYTRRIQELVRQHVDVSEAFAEAGMNVLRDIVTRFDGKRALWSCIVKVSAEVDALIGLSIASFGDGSGRMVRPRILPESHPCPVLECEQLRHPVLAARSNSFVANDTFLGGTQTIALITGSNCSGKSTLSRQVAVAVILAQIGMFVPAASMKLRPFTSMFARAGSRDEISRGRSTFMVEMEEAALIVNTATDRSLVIVDELCSGTTAQDAHAISHATIEHLLKIGCLTIFCTHADSLAVEFAGRVGNFTMAAEVDQCNKSILFLYKLVRGVTSHSRGVFCARVAGIPAVVADRAEVVAQDHENSIRHGRDHMKFCTLMHSLSSSNKGAEDVLIAINA